MPWICTFMPKMLEIPNFKLRYEEKSYQSETKTNPVGAADDVDGRQCGGCGAAPRAAIAACCIAICAAADVGSGATEDVPCDVLATAATDGGAPDATRALCSAAAAATAICLSFCCCDCRYAAISCAIFTCIPHHRPGFCNENKLLYGLAA